MSESAHPPADPEPELPHEDELDIEGPNESAPGHQPNTGDEQAAGEGD